MKGPEKKGGSRGKKGRKGLPWFTAGFRMLAGVEGTWGRGGTEEGIWYCTTTTPRPPPRPAHCWSHRRQDNPSLTVDRNQSRKPHHGSEGETWFVDVEAGRRGERKGGEEGVRLRVEGGGGRRRRRQRKRGKVPTSRKAPRRRRSRRLASNLPGLTFRTVPHPMDTVAPVTLAEARKMAPSSKRHKQLGCAIGLLAQLK